ncbi:thioredoxin [Sarocladium strictum]
MAIHEITSDEAFYQTIKDNTVVMIDFYATWCSPCKVIAPFIKKHSEEDKYKDIFFAKIDVDKLSKLSDDLDIQAMPTLLMFKNGEKSDMILDPNPKKLVEFLDKAI